MHTAKEAHLTGGRWRARALWSIYGDMRPAPYCLCAPVTEKAIENVRANGGAGAYKDTHPWYLAQEMLAQARSRDETLVVLFASGEPEEFGWWAEIEDIDVEAFHRGTWETRCAFSGLRPVAEIFRPLDSVALYPGVEQLRREAIEPVTLHRQYLNRTLLRPYAIAETPPFVGREEAAPEGGPEGGPEDAPEDASEDGPQDAPKGAPESGIN